MVQLSGFMTGMGISLLLFGEPITDLFLHLSGFMTGMEMAGIGLAVVGLLTAPFMPWM